jgi:hypothetical protein
MRISMNHNSLGCEQPLGLDVEQSPNPQDAFRPIPGLISCAGVTGSVGVLRYARMAGLIELSMLLPPLISSGGGTEHRRWRNVLQYGAHG